MDALILAIDRAARTLSQSATARRSNPSANISHQPPLSASDTAQSIGLMRVNHAGEVAAQALYQGQAFGSRSPELRGQLADAADEEMDHLAWTRDRIYDLGGRTSLLDPVWYAGAFAMGAVAGALGDRTSLGFLQATEEQVEAHLASHLGRLPEADQASRAIVEQMKADEAKHARMAHALGARELPAPVQTLMRLSAKVMTAVAQKI